jgi:DNA helicase II / ATP-dependent DNA helicase PcrA
LKPRTSKDVLSVLRWCENPRDRVAGFRVLQLLPGVGPTTAAKILDQIAGGHRINDLSAVKPPKAAAEDWPGFAELIKAIHNANKTWPAEMHLVMAWYEPHLARLYDDSHKRIADLAQLEQIAGTYKSREKFLTELTLDPPDATTRAGAPSRDEEFTVLSTIHSAKGQEWKIVRILNVVDGCIPSDMATDTPEEIEEERRLLCVAMTRAKNDLDLIVPLKFYTHRQSGAGDQHMYADVSPFVSDIKHSALERKTWAERIESTPTSAVRSGRAIDVTSSIRQMWGRRSA